jgi:hypothetical protein
VPAHVARPPLAPFLLLAVGLAVAGLVALLLLNTLVAQDSFRLSALQRDHNALAEREQVLVARVSALDAPGGLARRAERLGMVPAGAPAFLDLSSGRSVGKPTKARAPARPAPKPATTTTPAGRPKAATPTKTAKASGTAKKSKSAASTGNVPAPEVGKTAARKATG